MHLRLRGATIDNHVVDHTLTLPQPHPSNEALSRETIDDATGRAFLQIAIKTSRSC